jgi:hypothetical protein
MVQRLCSFLVVFLLIFSGDIFGQQKSILLIPQTPLLSTRKEVVVFKPKFSITQVIKANDCTGMNKYRLLNLPTASYYPNSLGFVCKKELQLDKITAVPLRFRLGSLDYVNYMEIHHVNCSINVKGNKKCAGKKSRRV